MSNEDVPSALKTACSKDIKQFVAGMNEIIIELEMCTSRAEFLESIITDRKELVSLNI
jgi:hypothetical protein